MIKSPLNRRVVITGLGVVSSLGIGWKEFWPNLMAGKSGISRIEAFDTSPYDRHYGGEIKNFDPTLFMNQRKARQIGRASQMAIAASKLALEDAELNIHGIDRKQIGVCMGTTVGELRMLEKFEDVVDTHLGQIDHLLMSFFAPNFLSSNIASELKFFGFNKVFGTACASGNYAVGQAFDLIKKGRISYMLAGGADSFSRVIFTGFSRVVAIAPGKCQPFDKNRQGMIPGEGAGMLFLESLESAEKRGAPIYAEVLGYGMSCDAYDMTEPTVNGIEKAIRKTLKNSGVEPEQIDYISAHGTGTVENDAAECRAYQRVFNNQARTIPVSSIKSMLGHTMGAASAFETISCCLALKHQEVPPTINLEEQDPECDIDCVPHKGRKHKVKTILNNSQAFGGNNACLSLQAC